MRCVEKPCDVCLLSEWSEWQNISSQCMVTGKRFRNYYGKNCNRTNVEEQARKFEKNCTCLLDDVLYQVISLTLRNFTSLLFN